MFFKQILNKYIFRKGTVSGAVMSVFPDERENIIAP